MLLVDYDGGISLIDLDRVIGNLIDLSQNKFKYLEEIHLYVKKIQHWLLKFIWRRTYGT